MLCQIDFMKSAHCIWHRFLNWISLKSAHITPYVIFANGAGTLMINFTNEIKPGIQLGKENGLSILLDAEVCVISIHLLLKTLMG